MQPSRPFLRFTLILVTLFLFNSCGGGGSGIPVTAMIGPAGGSVSSADRRLTLLIPAGALGEATEISIRPVNLSELGSEFTDIAPIRAYQLEPDGLTFSTPITVEFDLQTSSTKSNGDLEAELFLAFTSSNGVLELPDNQVISVDLDSGRSIFSSELAHFSKLVLSSEKGVTITVSGVPGSMPVNSSFLAAVTITNKLSAQGFAKYELLAGAYSDNSVLPIKPTYSQKSKFLSEQFPLTSPNMAEQIFPYTCTAVGNGTYSAVVAAALQASLGALIFDSNLKLDGKFGYAVDVKKGIKCIGPGEAQPNPSPSDGPGDPLEDPSSQPCLSAGIYSSSAAGCGISTFKLTKINGEGNLIIDGFGANIGSFTFNKSSNSKKFQSVRTDLTIFNIVGHTCVIECGPGENEVTLTCTHLTSICSEVFTHNS